MQKKPGKMAFSTPVLFVIFNRPDVTRRVFEVIRRIQPGLLFIAADGPRTHIMGESDQCVKTRQIIQEIDWECETRLLLSDTNQGCKSAVSNAINWFFDNVEEGIILEDDCLPDLSFFLFCEKMLNRYRNDTRVMMISGTNMLGQWKNEMQDYCFSYYGGIWGWASWKRAWQHYDVKMTRWNDSNESLKNILTDKKQLNSRLALFRATFNGEIDTWDYQWSFARMINSGLSIVPSFNLISNIGFGANATHTKDASNLANLPRHVMPEHIRDNSVVVVDRDYDHLFFERSSKTLWSRLLGKLRS
jgi:hypothetical protein